MSALRIPWDIHEAILLLDAFHKIEEGSITQKQAVAQISIQLREKAKREGIEIDDVYRNKNGIALQLSHMSFVASDGKKHGTFKSASKTFYEAVRLYKEDRQQYNLILKEVEEIVGVSSLDADMTPTQDVLYEQMQDTDESMQMLQSYKQVESICECENIEAISYNHNGKDHNNDEMAKRYSIILYDEFQEGFRFNRIIDLGRFKECYANKYGEKISISDNEIISYLKEIGTVLEGRIFPKRDVEQKNLICEIYQDILLAFEESASCIYIEAVMQKYEERLAKELYIYNMDTLKEVLLSCANGKYKLRYSYLYINNRKIDTKQEVTNCLKMSHFPMSYRELEERLWYIPLNRIKHILVTTPEIVNVNAETYFFAPNFPISKGEQEKICDIINHELQTRNFIVDTEMKSLIDINCPSVAINTKDFSVWGFRNALGCLLRDNFSFKGRIISKLGTALNMTDVFAEFCRKQEIIRIDELQEFANEINDRIIYWDSVMNEMVRISNSVLVRNDQITFDVDAVDKVLDVLCTDSYMSIPNVGLYLQFPEMSVKWNGYLLESYLYKYSKLFRLVHIGFSTKDYCGIMVRRASPFLDYEEVVVDFLSHSQDWNTKEEVLALLVEQGFQKRKKYTRIEALMQKAKPLKTVLNE